MQLNKILRQLLAEKDIKAAALARAVKLPPTTISNWLLGQKPRDLDQVRKVAKYLDVSIEYLCFGEDTKKKDLISENLDEIHAGNFEVVLRRVKKQ